MLAECGGFDERLRFGEDVDLVWRLNRRGWSIRYEPSAEVSHLARRDWRHWLRQRLDYGASAAPLAQRHGRAVAPVRVSLWSALAWTLVLAGLPGTLTAALTGGLLPRRLRAVGVPAGAALRLAGLGHLQAGRWLGLALLRAWWPLAVLVAVASRRARVALALATACYVIEWWDTRPSLRPLAWWALRLLDDLVYGAGVWAGSVRCRSTRALWPDVSDWPGRGGVINAASTTRQ